MQFTALLIATNRANRLTLLDQAVSYLDQQKFPFVQKIVSIDQVESSAIPADLIKKLESAGWTVLVEYTGSKAQSLLNALAITKGDVVYYNEDDIKAKFPLHTDIETAWTIMDHYEQRRLGMLSMTLGGSTHDFPSGKYGDLDQIAQRTFYSTPDYIFFTRDETKRSEYFFEFPGLFVVKDLFAACLRPGIPNHAIECELTNSWFRNKFNEQYYKVSVCKPNAPEVLKDIHLNYYREVLETIKLQRLLDPWQGGIEFDLSRIPDLD